MWTVLVILLVVWAVLSVVGFAIEGLFWLAVIGIILFVGTVVFGLVRNRGRKGRQRPGARPPALGGYEQGAPHVRW